MLLNAWVLIGLWVLLAFAMAAVPSNDNHWRRAYVLIGIGVPIVLWIIWNDGVLMGLVALAVGGSVLRWPVYFLWQWLKARFRRG